MTDTVGRSLKERIEDEMVVERPDETDDHAPDSATFSPRGYVVQGESPYAAGDDGEVAIAGFARAIDARDFAAVCVEADILRAGYRVEAVHEMDPETDTSSDVTAAECADIRERRRDGETVRAIADSLDRAPATVTRHARGAAGCDHAPADRVVRVEERTHTTAAECADIRARRRDGETVRAIADALGRGVATVSRHARGECGHDPGLSE